MPAALFTLRQLRQPKMTLRQLQAATGINRGTLSQIERGRLVASTDELQAIAQALALDRLENRIIPIYEGGPVTVLLARDERGYEELDPVDILDTVLRCRLYEHPLDLEAWIDSRIIGMPLNDIAAQAPRRHGKPELGVTRQCVSLRARNCERAIAAKLGLKAHPQPQLDGRAA